MHTYSLLIVAALSCTSITHASQKSEGGISLPSRPSLQAPLNPEGIHKWSESMLTALYDSTKNYNDFTANAQNDAISLLSDLLKTSYRFGLDNPSERTLDLLRSAREKFSEIEERLKSFFPSQEGAANTLRNCVNDIKEASSILNDAFHNHEYDKNPNDPNTIPIFDDDGNNRGYLRKRGSHIDAAYMPVDKNKTGPLPPRIFEDSDEDGRVRLSGESFSGSIPTTIGTFKGERIDLSGNKLTGTIPESIGNCTNLTHLYLSKNALTGEMPSTFRTLKKMEAFDVSNNGLTKIVLPETYKHGKAFGAVGEISENPLLSIAPYSGEQMFVLPQKARHNAVHFDGAVLNSRQDIWHALHTLATNPLVVAVKDRFANLRQEWHQPLQIVPIRVDFADRKEDGTWSAGGNTPYALTLTIHPPATPGAPKTIRVKDASDTLISRLGMDKAGIQKMLEDTVFQPTPPARMLTKAASAR